MRELALTNEMPALAKAADAVISARKGVFERIPNMLAFVEFVCEFFKRIPYDRRWVFVEEAPYMITGIARYDRDRDKDHTERAFSEAQIRMEQFSIDAKSSRASYENHHGDARGCIQENHSPDSCRGGDRVA
ncbi:hypothetical protein [Acidocella facilis]|uniref:hypothetical protein n=1 Tax=Acidocella facilis TaxID=525 RepID=UPI001F263D47|nr:hypothetical protein [Acidocella facilis]